MLPVPESDDVGDVSFFEHPEKISNVANRNKDVIAFIKVSPFE